MQTIKCIGQVLTASFVSKAGNIAALREEERKSRYMIDEIVVLSEDEFWKFGYGLSHDYEWLKGKGGTHINAEDHEPYMFQNEPHQWSAEENELWRKYSYRKCVGVITAKSNEMILVDPQGYNYARYAALVTL